jgi:hypothetical protein
MEFIIFILLVLVPIFFILLIAYILLFSDLHK